MKQLWIIAGPNGSGKTTLVQRYIERFAQQVPVVNPDEIAVAINASDPGSVAMQAGRKALLQQNQYLKNGESFLLETTFSGKREIKLIRQAKKQRFKVNLIFVGLPDPKRNIKRVNRRVLDGGHNVPIEDIIRRYHRSMGNLTAGLALADRAFVFDNYGKKHQLVAVFQRGNIVRRTDQLPSWFESNVKISKSVNLQPATVGLVTIKKDVIASPDFQAGKAGDPTASDRIVNQVWSDKKTEQLREHLSDNSIFLTMPSTTRLNVIPIQLAKFLSRKTGHPWAIGDEIFKTSHQVASKNIPRNKRLFQSKKFEIRDEKLIEKFKEYKIVIVDDIITTGGSIRVFSEFLKDQKIKVDHVIGLMGDRRFEIDKKTAEKLRKLLKEKNIGINFESINYLTRTEAGGLIQSLNNARSDNAIQKLAEQLQGISRFGVTSNFERTPGTDRNQSPGRKNIGNGRTCERVQTYSSASSTRGCAWKIEFFKGGQPVKKEEVILSAHLGKKEEQDQLRDQSRRIATAYSLGLVQVKFTRTGETKKIELQKEKKIDRGR